MAPRKNLTFYLLLLYAIFTIAAILCWDFLRLKVAEMSLNDNQVERKQLIKDYCRSQGLSGPMELTTYKLKPLIMNDDHGLIYCYIPKVASTHMKKIMFVLKNGEPYIDPDEIHENVHLYWSHFHLAKGSSSEFLKAKLKHYTKFMFVRHPFVRIISAYLSKFRQLNPYFYNKYGRDILRLYTNHTNPPETVEEARRKHINPSFENFIQYLVDPRTEKERPFDKHWIQMNRLCDPCLIDFDFIGHLETMQVDFEHLLKILNLQNSITLSSAYENVTSDHLKSWYGTVPLEDRRKLYKLYETDFKIFGYRRPDELLEG